MKKYFFFLIFLIPCFLLAQDTDITSLPSPEEETSRFTYEFIKMMLILGGMVGILLYISYYMRRMTTNKLVSENDSGLIKIIEHRSVSPRSNLILVEVEGHNVLISETPHGVVKLTEYTEPKENRL